MFSFLVIRLRSLRLLRVSCIVMRLRMFLLLFFFLVEDGIRDLYVTGVQTCVLPIWPGARPRRPGLAGPGPGRPDQARTRPAHPGSAATPRVARRPGPWPRAREGEGAARGRCGRRTGAPAPATARAPGPARSRRHRSRPELPPGRAPAPVRRVVRTRTTAATAPTRPPPPCRRAPRPAGWPPRPSRSRADGRTGKRTGAAGPAACVAAGRAAAPRWPPAPSPQPRRTAPRTPTRRRAGRSRRSFPEVLAQGPQCPLNLAAVELPTGVHRRLPCHRIPLFNRVPPSERRSMHSVVLPRKRHVLSHGWPVAGRVRRLGEWR